VDRLVVLVRQHRLHHYVLFADMPCKPQKRQLLQPPSHRLSQCISQNIRERRREAKAGG
jgi:hypothetical protein